MKTTGGIQRRSALPTAEARQSVPLLPTQPSSAQSGEQPGHQAPLAPGGVPIHTYTGADSHSAPAQGKLVAPGLRVPEPELRVPDKVDRKQAFCEVFAAMDTAQQDFFFRPKNANALRRGKKLPELSAEQVKQSLEKPVPFTAETWMYGGHVFMNRFFMRARGRGGAGFQHLSSLRSDELIGKQPWLEWDEAAGRYLHHSGGACDKLKTLVQDKSFYRGASFAERQTWKMAQQMLEQVADQDSTSDAVAKVHRRAASLLQNLCPEYGSVSCTPDRDAARAWAISSGWKGKGAGVVMRFDMELDKLAAEQQALVFLGIEDGYVEVGFTGEEVRLQLARRLQGG